MYIVLILLLILLLFISYNLFKRELLYPPIVTVAMFLFCSLVGLLRYDDWKMDEYSALTVVLVLIGLISFIFSSFIVYLFFQENTKKNIVSINQDKIKINSFFLYFVLIILIIYNYLYYNYLVHNVANVGVSIESIGAIINFVRNMESLGFEKLPWPFYIRCLDFFSSAFCTFSLFVFIHNVIFQRIEKNDLLFLLIVILGFVHHLLNGSRGYILLYLAQSVYLSYFFWNMQVGWKPTVNKKIAKMFINIGMFFLPFFILLAVMVGRVESLDMNDVGRNYVFEHLTVYISSGIRNFDLYVQQPVEDSTIFGKETFYSINRFLYNRFGIGEYYRAPLELSFINGEGFTNIYTAFRRYYADFGILGIFLIPMFLGFFFSFLYSKAKSDARKGTISFYMLFFSSISNSIFYFPVEDWFFIFNVSVNQFVVYVLLYLIFYCLYKKRTSNKIVASQKEG